MMTRDERLLAALQDLVHSYPTTKVGPQTLEAYLRDLGDLPIEAVEFACQACVRTNRFFPSIAELRETVATHLVGDAAQAHDAWNEVRTQASRIGRNAVPLFQGGRFVEDREPTFSSRVTEEAVKSLGWRYICTGEQSEVREEFLRTYYAMRKRELQRLQYGFWDATDILQLHEREHDPTPVLNGSNPTT
ncbi:MAG TPA: hypothetical protein VNZ55_12280 [Thermomicrobiales bacterium]|nr:hypothetical protein [Thermomicrobiales bacterium]